MRSRIKEERAPSSDSTNRSISSSSISHWLFVAFLLWICLLHGTAILTFTKGFFLTKYEVKNTSRCDANPSPYLSAAR